MRYFGYVFKRLRRIASDGAVAARYVTVFGGVTITVAASVGVSFFSEQRFKKYRAEYRRNNYKHYRRDERIQAAAFGYQRVSRGVNRQGDFASRNHSATYRKGVFIAEFKRLRHKSATYDFAYYSEGDESKSEQKITEVETRKVRRYADIREEDGGEYHIAAHDDFSVYELRVLETAQHYARHIRARNRRYVEYFFGAIGEQEAHTESVYARPSLMREFVTFPSEIKSEEYSETYREREESDRS